eukprot:TRINITY_DN5325_c0_g1_i1.p1 TRINITY_DN5325_c0_g1~~TRINITY_DN5325_c0_g1_i1.p1  ORF type:complete len:282 (-),score=80.51 TRINITY_DN5325_c0_g1_i1:25-870(-)
MPSSPSTTISTSEQIKYQRQLATRSMVTFVVQIDLCGWLPSMITQLMSSYQPLRVAKLRKCLKDWEVWFPEVVEHLKQVKEEHEMRMKVAEEKRREQVSELMIEEEQGETGEAKGKGKAKVVLLHDGEVDEDGDVFYDARDDVCMVDGIEGLEDVQRHVDRLMKEAKERQRGIAELQDNINAMVELQRCLESGDMNAALDLEKSLASRIQGIEKMKVEAQYATDALMSHQEEWNATLERAGVKTGTRTTGVVGSGSGHEEWEGWPVAVMFLVAFLVTGGKL